MKKSTLIAIAAALAAIAAELDTTGAVAAINDETDTPDNDTQETTPAPTSGRGSRGPRKPKEEAEAPVGKTLDELKAIIKPLIDDARGDEVKKIIAKYGASLKEIPAEKHADFIKDIDAISY